MLHIRAREKSAFVEDQVRAFDDRVVGVLRRSFPRLFEEQGEPAVRAFVQSWRPVVEGWGIEKEKELAHALNVLFALVHDLGEDPRSLPWLRDVMDGRRAGLAKVQQLYVGLYAAYDAQSEAQRAALAEEPR